MSWGPKRPVLHPQMLSLYLRSLGCQPRLPLLVHVRKRMACLVSPEQVWLKKGDQATQMRVVSPILFMVTTSFGASVTRVVNLCPKIMWFCPVPYFLHL